MMHLGKRPRPQRENSFLRRTTSMTSLDLEEKEFQQQEPPQKNAVVQVSGDVFRPWMIAKFPGVIRPEPAHFLQACFRCNDRLRPGKDIYMYRGDAAFCSLECRNQQIYLDERRAKFMAAARQKKQTPAANGGGSANPRQRQQSTADGNENTLAAT